MADEVRRSGRATKGQHTKAFEVPDGPPTKRKGKAQAKAKQTSADPEPAQDEYIRCICGQYEEEEEIEREMICCDKCEAWQHNDCMELTEVPEQYFCEACRPDLHQGLLAKVARGEKPWEETAKRRQKEIEELKAKKKKGGKRGGRKSTRGGDVKPAAEEDNANGTGTPAREAAVTAHESRPSSKPATPVPSSGGQKRKAEEADNAVKSEQESKKMKKGPSPLPKDATSKNGSSASDKHKLMPSTLKSAPQNESPAVGGLVRSVAELVNDARKKAASLLIKTFVDQIKITAKEGSFVPPEGETQDTYGNKLGLQVEDAVYQNLCGGIGNPSTEYSNKIRSINFNVKKNHVLRDRLLVGSLSAFALSSMSTEDMASPELKQQNAQLKKDADKQAILIQETGPRIRRTHKGEEFVGDENHQVSEPMFQANVPRRRESAIDENATQDKVGSPRSPVIPDERDEEKQWPAPIDTSGEHRSSNFNINDVWDHARSPDVEKHRGSRQTSIQINEPVSNANAQPDAEIDQLLKDEDVESEPYSPKEFSEEGIVWNGKITMVPVADFAASAKFAGGANPSPKILWSQLLPPTVQIDGRIDIERASKYLCGLKFSSSTDISVVAINQPDGSNARDEFDKLFAYFTSRKRYGVVGRHPLAAVKDTYIIPVETGEGTIPEFMSLLANSALEEPVPARVILIAFVIKHKDPSSAGATPRVPDSAIQPVGSPSSAVRNTPSMPQPTQYSPVPPIGFNGHQSPYQQQPAFGSPNQPQLPFAPPAHAPTPAYQTQPQPQPRESLTGADAAAHVLGPLAKAPAVQELIKQVPGATVEQMDVVRNIIMNVPRASEDLKILTEVLQGQASKDSG